MALRFARNPNSKRAGELKAKPFDLAGYRQSGDMIRDLRQLRSESVAAG
jgi:hypothetical protein